MAGTKGLYPVFWGVRLKGPYDVRSEDTVAEGA